MSSFLNIYCNNIESSYQRSSTQATTIHQQTLSHTNNNYFQAFPNSLASHSTCPLNDRKPPRKYEM
jgi:hypothetical protein